MLTILTTHPIQYQVPLWRELARRLSGELEVWYLSDRGHTRAFDPGFGRDIAWDIDMLGGYPYKFVGDACSEPDSFRNLRARSLAPRFGESGTTALLVNGWYPRVYWDAVAQARRARIPVMLRAESNHLAVAPWWKRSAKRLALAYFFDRVSMFLAIGVANRRLYESYDIADDRIGEARYCVDNTRFAAAAEACREGRAALRQAYGIPADAMCFLFCGKLIAKKRVTDLLQAFARMHNERGRDGVQPVHLVVAGDGELRDSLARMASAIRDAAGRPCVTSTGFLNQSEVPKAYAAADCLVLPSDASETWGLVVNEAMACGLPAIVSDSVGCAADLIDAGRTGDIFPTGSVAALADLLNAWARPERCIGARTAVAQKIARYSIERAADGIVDGLAAIERGRAPRVSHRPRVTGA